MKKQELSKEELAVGLSFNPSGNELVNAAKEHSAKLLKILRESKNVKTDYEAKKVGWMSNVFYTAAFNAVIAAQMQIVKYITWSNIEE